MDVFIVSLVAVVGLIVAGGAIWWAKGLVGLLEERRVARAQQDRLYEEYLRTVERQRETVRQRALTPEGKNELLKEK